jgi:DNA-binding SARP family transcriptional activator
MTDSLRFHLFGPFEAFRNGQLITNQDWRSQQTRAVCKVLLAQRGQVVSSSQLIEILWPEDDPQAARRRLHVRVSQLRKTLEAGKARVQTVDGGYLFSPDEDCWLDVAAFQAGLDQAAQQQELGEQRLAIQAYEQARRLYRGDFLSEDLYVDWTFSLREFYRERFLTLLTELGECYAQQGRYRLAIARLQEALGHDPVRETIYLRLMLFHYYAGERDQALRVYERCRQVLADELAVEPLDSTASLAEQIRAGTLWASDQTPRYPPPIYEGRLFDVPYALSETPLVGRAVEYAWLVEQWQDERIRLLLVEGEAGIGKSRLVGAFAGYLRSQGWQVLSARVSTASRSPFAPLADALQPLLSLDNLVRLSPQKRAALEVLFPQVGDLVADLPALPALPPEAARQRLFQALQALVEVSLTRPRLLLIDDAQRLGEDAIDLLARLAGNIAYPVELPRRRGPGGASTPRGVSAGPERCDGRASAAQAAVPGCGPAVDPATGGQRTAGAGC